MDQIKNKYAKATADLSGTSITDLSCNYINENVTTHLGTITDNNQYIPACINEINSFLRSDTNKANDFLNTNIYIGGITTILAKYKTAIDELKTTVSTMEKSIQQQTNPEESISHHAQRTGFFAPPRPLQPLSISILLGISFIFFFTAFLFIQASLPTIPSGIVFSFANLKNLLIGLSITVIIVLILKVANLI